MTDAPDKWRAVAEEAYWLLAWTYQSHCLAAPRALDMSVFAPEAYLMMNEGERCLYRALCLATGHTVLADNAHAC